MLVNNESCKTLLVCVRIVRYRSSHGRHWVEQVNGHSFQHVCVKHLVPLKVNSRLSVIAASSLR